LKVGAKVTTPASLHSGGGVEAAVTKSAVTTAAISADGRGRGSKGDAHHGRDGGGKHDWGHYVGFGAHRVHLSCQIN
jgi:hypothetical protein